MLDRKRARRSRFNSALVAATLSLSAAAAHAQTSANGAAAQGLFDEAKALMIAKKFAEACPKLEESQRLDPGSGTLMNLAKCYEETGRLASAWNAYLEAAALAKAVGNTARERGARQRAAALAPRVSRLVVKVPAAARIEGLEVRRGQTVVGSAQWDVAVPSDAGTYTLQVTAPGHEPWQAEVVVPDEGETVEVSVPVLAAAKQMPDPKPAPAPSGPVVAAEPPSSGLGTQKLAAIAAGGLGVAGLAVGTLFGIRAISRKSDAEPCSGAVCGTQEAADAGNDAHSAGNVATIGMVVGAVGVASALTLWFTAPVEGGPKAQLGLGVGSVQVRGAW